MRDLKGARSVEPSARWMRLKVYLIGGVFLCLLAGVFVRAVVLQVFERERLRTMARDQYVREIEIPARRGEIFDRRGVPLAQSVEVDSIWIDPSMITDPKAVAKTLSAKTGVPASELSQRFSGTKRFAWVKRQATSAEVSAVAELKLPGIGFAKEPRRFYPQRELAAHLVGMVGTDGHGLEGLELAFEDELSGRSARMSSFRDAKGRKVLTGGLEDPRARQGATLELTIDGQLQFLAEQALSRAVEDAKAVGGMAVVLEPQTGALLALANHPRFNPNTPSQSDRSAHRNRAALDTFEPGSTFKSFVIAGALDQKVIRPDEVFDCEGGNFVVGRNTIHDSHPYKELNVEEILQVSSNICTAKIAQRFGRQKLVETYSRFGFGEKVGLALPGEGKGVLPFPKAEIALATQAFGQGLTATAVQLAAGYGALANEGVLMKPYLVSRVVDADGLVLLSNQPTPVRQVVSASTARKVVRMLESVVEKEGTAPRARMNEYRVAGKTGTAQKADPVARGYSDKRIASFIGIVPADAPKLVILVVVDEPKTDVYGGLVAAPAFKEIAAGALPYLGIAPNAALLAAAPSPPKPLAKRPVPAFVPPEPSESVTETAQEGSVRVPNLAGLAARPAVNRLLGAALVPHLSGSGTVVTQTPPAGSVVERGARVTLELAKALP